ncbi:MAG: serine/threonine protein kinase [Chloroflexi bacterium]|nr:MAG: serine/threonine protein kinase [Chloroflexota bacterium]MBL1193785.1 serine/threonine protein kinase [Chloroflexota bacterium]NOH11078.1 serine/threonine protein kinase [Chloroflexota bacterium]
MAGPSWVGKKLSDRYEIEDLLGQGGMSAVYKANDPNLRRTVAVKLIHSHLSEDAQFVSRFEEEAAAVAQLRHPNIIQVYDFSNDEETYYMVLEFLAGETLQERQKRLSAGKKRVANKEAIENIASICDALDYAHNRGMIHRDIKPANIMINVQGDAILMDFGVAKIVGGKQHTATGAVVGTALYMSPEQIKGEEADRRVDIYALGVTLYEMLTGSPPFEADSAMSTLMMHVNDPVPDIRKVNPDVPASLVQVVGKALAKDKNQRYQTAKEFADALRGIDLSKADAEDVGATMVETPADAGATMVETPAVDAGATMVEQETAAPGATMVEATPVGATGTEAPAPPVPPSATSAGAAGGGARKGIFAGGAAIAAAVVGCIVIAGIGYFAYTQFSGGGGTTADPTATEAAVVVEEPTETTAPLPTDTTGPPTETLPPTEIPTATVPPGFQVRIRSITLENGTYVVEYETFEYMEGPDMHIHFFWDTVAPEQAGSPGSGPWALYRGPRPFTQYTTGNQPAGATQICALVANANHSVIADSGNCYDLPEG